MQITFDNYNLLFEFLEKINLLPNQKAELFVGKKHIITIYGLNCEKNFFTIKINCSIIYLRYIKANWLINVSWKRSRLK